MKKFLFLLGLGITSCNPHLHTRSFDDTSFKKQLEDYIATNSSISLGYEKEGYTKICPVDTARLSYLQYIFKHLNKIYASRIITIDKVDKTFLSQFKPESDNDKKKYYSYRLENDSMYAEMSIHKDTVVAVLARPNNLPQIFWCNGEKISPSSILRPDFRFLRYIDIKIPIKEWSIYHEPMFGWDIYH